MREPGAVLVRLAPEGLAIVDRARHVVRLRLALAQDQHRAASLGLAPFEAGLRRRGLSLVARASRAAPLDDLLHCALNALYMVEAVRSSADRHLRREGLALDGQ